MIEFDLLIRIAEKISGFERDIIISKKRIRPVVEVRMICTNIIKKHHHLTVEQVGILMNIDHSTVSYHMKTHNALISQKDGEYKNLYNQINNKYQIELIYKMKNSKIFLLDKKEKFEKMLEAVNNSLKHLENENTIIN